MNRGKCLILLEVLWIFRHVRCLKPSKVCLHFNCSLIGIQNLFWWFDWYSLFGIVILSRNYDGKWSSTFSIGCFRWRCSCFALVSFEIVAHSYWFTFSWNWWRFELIWWWDYPIKSNLHQDYARFQKSINPKLMKWPRAIQACVHPMAFTLCHRKSTHSSMLMLSTTSWIVRIGLLSGMTILLCMKWNKMQAIRNQIQRQNNSEMFKWQANLVMESLECSKSISLGWWRNQLREPCPGWSVGNETTETPPCWAAAAGWANGVCWAPVWIRLLLGWSGGLELGNWALRGTAKPNGTQQRDLEASQNPKRTSANTSTKCQQMKCDDMTANEWPQDWNTKFSRKVITGARQDGRSLFNLNKWATR